MPRISSANPKAFRAHLFISSTAREIMIFSGSLGALLIDAIALYMNLPSRFVAVRGRFLLKAFLWPTIAPLASTLAAVDNGLRAHATA